MPAQLAWMFYTFAGGKPGPFETWLPEWMRPQTSGKIERQERIFSQAVIEDVELAFKLDLLSQGALAALGPTRLRQAGAFKPN